MYQVLCVNVTESDPFSTQVTHTIMMRSCGKNQIFDFQSSNLAYKWKKSVISMIKLKSKLKIFHVQSREHIFILRRNCYKNNKNTFIYFIPTLRTENYAK